MSGGTVISSQMDLTVTRSSSNYVRSMARAEMLKVGVAGEVACAAESLEERWQC
jgi:hypothetical protein